MKPPFFSCIGFFLIVAISGAFSAAFADEPPVSIVDRGNYYEVTISYAGCANGFQMGKTLAEKIHNVSFQRFSY